MGSAGAHDGKSPLEARFNAVCSAAPGRVVVKSAGNEAREHGHAKFSVGRNARTALTWRRAQGALWPHEHVELWWRYGNELEFRLGSPSSLWSRTVALGQPTAKGLFEHNGIAATGGPGTGYSLQLVPSHPDHGDSVLRIDLEGKPDIQSGLWQLESSAAGSPRTQRYMRGSNAATRCRRGSRPFSRMKSP